MNSYLESTINSFSVSFSEYDVLVDSVIMNPTEDLDKIAEQLSLVYATPKNEVSEYLNVWIDKAIGDKDKKLYDALSKFDASLTYEQNACNFINEIISQDEHEEYAREFIMELFNNFYIRNFIKPVIQTTLENWDRKIASFELFKLTNLKETINYHNFTAGKVEPLFMDEFIKYYEPIFIAGFNEHLAQGLHYNDYYKSKLEIESQKVNKHFNDLLPKLFTNDDLDDRIAEFTSKIILTLGQVSWNMKWEGHGRLRAEDAYILMNEHASFKERITKAVNEWSDNEKVRLTNITMGIPNESDTNQ